MQEMGESLLGGVASLSAAMAGRGAQQQAAANEDMGRAVYVDLLGYGLFTYRQVSGLHHPHRNTKSHIGSPCCQHLVPGSFLSRLYCSVVSLTRNALLCILGRKLARICLRESFLH